MEICILLRCFAKSFSCFNCCSAFCRAYCAILSESEPELEVAELPLELRLMSSVRSGVGGNSTECESDRLGSVMFEAIDRLEAESARLLRMPAKESLRADLMADG